MINILITGVGAIIGQGIIKSIRKSCYPTRIIGVDRNDRSPGPSFCDEFYKKPDCDETDARYLSFWRWLFKERNIDLVLIGLEVDMFFFDKYRFLFEQQLGVTIVLNQAELISLSSDKWMQVEVLQSYNMQNIPSCIPRTWKEAIEMIGPPPLLLKPRQGNGSRGIVILHDEIDFLYWRVKTKESWMLQRIIGVETDEYTVGLFGFGDGSSLPPIVLRRKLSNAGNTLEAQVVEDVAIEQASVTLTNIFKPLGPTNYQFRKQDDTAYLLEINPRFSSSASLRTLFGYNEAEMCVEYFIHGKKPVVPKIRHGIAWRYSEDFVRYDRDSF